MSAPLFLDQIKSLDAECGSFDGYVQLDSSGAIVTENIKGVTVAKTGTGQYTFYLGSASSPRPCVAIKFVDAKFVASTAVDLVPQIQSFTNSQVVVSLLTAGTPTNPSAACGLFFFAVVTYSKL